MEILYILLGVVAGLATIVAALALAVSPLLVASPAEAGRGHVNICRDQPGRPCPPPCDFVQGCNEPQSRFLCDVNKPCPPPCEWVRPCGRRSVGGR